MLFGLFGKKKCGCRGSKDDTANLVELGEVTHYFPHVKAGVIKISKGSVSVGDTVRIKGHTTNFKQKISSMQVDNKPIESADTGKEIGIQVKKRVRGGDKVYKV